MIQQNFQRSLLKGILEFPFENLAELEDQIFVRLNPEDKYLINDTLLAFANTGDKFPYEITEAEVEKFEFAPLPTAILFKKLKKTYLTHSIPFLIRVHLKNKVLFQPEIILHVLSNRDLWDDHITLLVKVIRERGRWLAKMNKDWHWWYKSFNADTWSEKKDGLRFMYLRVLRQYKTEEARQLIVDAWQEEKSESKRMILRIISETWSEDDNEMLESLFFNEKSQIRNVIRKLMFMSEKSEGYLELKKLAEIHGVFNIANSYSQSSILSKYNYSQSEISVETLFSLPFSSFLEKNVSKKFSDLIDNIKDKDGYLNDLIINYLHKRDLPSLISILNHFMVGEKPLKFNRCALITFANAEIEFVNELCGEILACKNTDLKWHFFHQIIGDGNVRINKKNTGTLIQMIRKEITSCPFKKNELEDFISSGCFSIFSGYLGDWQTCCEEIAFNLEDLNYQKVNSKIQSLINFRIKFESYLPHGSK